MFLTAEQDPPVFQVEQSCFVIVRHLLQDGETIEVLRNEETSFGDSRGSVSLQFTAELAGGYPTGEICVECARHMLNIER